MAPISANIRPWRGGDKIYPQHTTMYDHDLKVSMLVRGPGLPQGKTVRGMVRSIGLVPSLRDLLHIDLHGMEFDGRSWLSHVRFGLVEGREAYSEYVFELRGTGVLQSLRSDSAKFIRNLTQGTEEYCDLKNDPLEQANILEQGNADILVPIRRELNRHLFVVTPSTDTFSRCEKDAIAKRLQALGCVE